MAQYKVTYTLFETPAHQVSQPGMSSLTMVVTAETNTQACDIVQAMMGPNAGYIQAQQM
jgi:hypothetical protein